MLIKLLKYDLKYMLKNMIIFYILSIIFAITTRIFFSLPETTINTLLGQISVGCMFSMIVSTLINTLMRSWARFNDSIYKDESYLTHTLPVSKNNIYDSKFIQTLIFFIVSFIVIIISLLIAYYTKDRWIMLKDLIYEITSSMNINTTFIIIAMLLVMFLEMFNLVQIGYLGLLLGHRNNSKKMGYSVVYAFIAYMVSQGISLLALLITGIFNSDIMQLFKNSDHMSSSTLKLLLIIAIITYALIIIIMNIVCKKIFNKGVNVE